MVHEQASCLFQPDSFALSMQISQSFVKKSKKSRLCDYLKTESVRKTDALDYQGWMINRALKRRDDEFQQLSKFISLTKDYN